MAKSRIMVACLSVVLALGVCAGVALAAPDDPPDAPLQAQSENLPPDLNDDGYQIRLENPAEGGTLYTTHDSLYFVLDDGSSSLTPGVVLYYQDESQEVPAEAYTVSYQKMGEASQPGNAVWEDVDTTQLEPGSMYRVVCTAVEDSGFTGTWSADDHGSSGAPFWVIGKNVLWPYEATLGESYAVALNDWPWIRYDIPEGEGYGLSLSLGGVVLDPTNYDVQWCDRKVSPDLMYNPETHEQAILPAQPTACGEYYACYEGTGDYQDGGVVIFNIVASGSDPVVGDISLERVGDDDDLFSDGTAEFMLNLDAVGGEAGVDWDVAFRAGKFRTFNDETMQFDEPLEQGEDFAYDASTRTVTVYGDKVFAKLGENGVVIRAYVVPAGLGESFAQDDVLAECMAGTGLREARIDYEGRRDVVDMLPHWRESVDRFSDMHVENAAYPQGEDFDYEVTNVEVESQDPVESGADVVAVERKVDENDETNYWWEYEAKACGTAVLKVTYRDPDEIGGEEGSYSFTVNVARDVYRVDVSPIDGSCNVLPGGSIELQAEGRHEMDYDPEGDDEPLTYDWRLVDDNDVAALTVDENDSTKATVAFRELTDEEVADGNVDDFERNVQVIVTMKGVEGSESVDRATNDVWLHMRANYTELWPMEIDSDLVVDDEAVIQAEVRKYPGSEGNDYDVVDGVDFQFDYVDTDAVEIKDADGTVLDNGDKRTGGSLAFTLKRQKEWEANFRLSANWEDGYSERWFHLNPVHVEDKYNFDSADVDMSFTAEVAGVGHYAINPMNGNYYGVPLSDVATFAHSLEVGIGGEPVPSANYKVTWYKADEDAVAKNMSPACDAAVGEALGALPDAAGAYVMVLEGVDSYHGQNGVLIDVFESMQNAEVTAVPDQEYTGAAIAPELSVSSNGKPLVQGSDYQVVYEDNVETGTAKAVVSGANPVKTNRAGALVVLDVDRFYAGTKTVEFNIVCTHDWGEPTYTWAADCGTCTATRVCGKSASHLETETVQATSEVTAQATYTAKGKTTYTATFQNAAFATQSKTVEDIAKLAQEAQPMKVKATAKTVKLAKVKKKARAVAPLKVTSAQGAVSYKVAGGNKKSKKALKLNTKTGKVTVKKGTKKGTYTIKVTVTAKGNAKYKAGSKTVSVTVKVK